MVEFDATIRIKCCAPEEKIDVCRIFRSLAVCMEVPKNVFFFLLVFPEDVVIELNWGAESKK